MKHSFSSTLRRLLALSLVLILAIGLTGCFQKEEPTPTDDPQAPVQTDPIQEDPTEAPTEQPTEAVVTPPTYDIVKGTVAANNLNVRSNPSTDSTVLSQLPVDLEIDILEQRTVGDTNWGRIGEMTLPNGNKINGGWINLHYVKLAGQEDPEPTEPTGGQTGGNGSDTVIAKGTITATELNVRKGTGTNYEAVAKYIKGDKVEILEKKVVGDTTWGRTNKGWISMKYVKLDGSTETNTNTNTGTNTNAEIESDGKTKVLGYGVVDLGALNVRSGPGTKYDKVGTVSEGERYAYYQKSGNWVRTEKGWVSVSYFYIEGTTADDATTGTVTADELNIRTGPDGSYKSNGVYKEGDSIKILAQVDGWGYTSKGWVSMKYVKLAEPTYATGKGTTTSGLNIRKEANAESEKVGSYEEGEKVTILEVKDGWGKTDKGWINLKYVKMDAAAKEEEPVTGTNTTFKKGTGTVEVNTTLSIRKEAKDTAEKIGSYKNGDKVTITEVSGEWGKTDKGWINLRYVKFD